MSDVEFGALSGAKQQNGIDCVIGTEPRYYRLNKDRALDKKLEYTNREEIVLEETGGGLKILVNTGTYELLRKATHSYYSSEENGFNIQIINGTDSNGLVVDTRYKVSQGRTHQYTINLYHTRCSLLINGKNENRFTRTDLPNILSQIENQHNFITHINESVRKFVIKYKSKIGTVNESLQQPQALQDNDEENTSRTQESDLYCTQHQAFLVNEEITNSMNTISTNSSADLPTMDSISIDNDILISDDTLVSEQQLGRIENAISNISSCIETLKYSLLTHIEDSSRKYEQIQDQLKSIKVNISANDN